mmetsp:Transcript_38044/g.88510  ORF Transcript_38044/g.88510 Transcript_38044/m.88510 type:complete len:314 (-) Transcript_38044:371-1312(-)
MAALAPRVTAIMRGLSSIQEVWEAAFLIRWPAAERAPRWSPSMSWQRASMRRRSVVLSPGRSLRRSCRVAFQFPPWGPAATKDSWTRRTRSRTPRSSSVSTVPSGPTEASDGSSAPASCSSSLSRDRRIPSPNFRRSASNARRRSAASSPALLSSSSLASFFSSSSALRHSLSLCCRTLPRARCSDRSHRSTKSASSPVFLSALSRSAPASSCTSAFLSSSARFHSLPAVHGRFPQWVRARGATYPSASSRSCSSRATRPTSFAASSSDWNSAPCSSAKRIAAAAPSSPSYTSARATAATEADAQLAPQKRSM